MTKQDSRGPDGDAPPKQEQKKEAASSTSRKKEDDREYDRRGVLMPRRSRIGGIIMPQ
ncbi:MAG: hypothetical protein ACRD28_13960 [Acidobacteriaceae bacterium]